MPGSTRAPPLSGTASASGPSGGRLGREAELAADPLEHLARGEDAAVERVLGDAADAPGDGGEEAARRLGDLVADVGEHEHAGAVGGLDAAGRHGAGAGQGGLLVDHAGGEWQVLRTSSVAKRAERADAVADLGQGVGGHAEALAQPRVPAGVAEAVQLGARGGRGVGGEEAAELVGQPRVDVAEAQRAAVARRLHLRHVLEQPGQLGGGEVRVERQAAAPRDLLGVGREAVEDRLRALVLPDDDGGERLAGLGVPREHRLALVVEAEGGRPRARLRAARRPRRRSRRGSRCRPARPSPGAGGATACAGGPL